MNANLDKLTKEVAEQVAVVDSAIVLIKGIAAMLAEAGTDATKLGELAATLDATQAALASAVAENTPAASTGEFAD